MRKTAVIFVAQLLIAGAVLAQTPPPQAPIPAGTTRPWTNVVGGEWPRTGTLLRWRLRGAPASTFKIRDLSVARDREPLD